MSSTTATPTDVPLPIGANVHRREIHITRVEHSAPLGNRGVMISDLEDAIMRAKEEYWTVTGSVAGSPIPAGAINVVPRQGELVVLFTYEPTAHL